MKHSVTKCIFKSSAALVISVLLALSPIRPSYNVNADNIYAATDQKVLDEYAVNTNTQAHYGYTMLAKEENGIAMQELYNQIDACVSKYARGGGDISRNNPYGSDSGEMFYEIPGASFSGTQLGLSVNEMVSVYFTYRGDHPEAFYLPPNYLFSESASAVYLVIPEAFTKQSERVKYSDLASKRLADFKKSLGSGISDYDTVIKAHDLLMEENFYRYDSGNIPSTKQSAHSLIGWLDGTGVVCEGYAKAFQFLLNGCGIDCLYVTGTTKGQAHAWNAVKCDSEWFWVDTTFNDQKNLPGGYYHYYLGLPNGAFLSDHTPGQRIFGAAYQVDLPNISDNFDCFYYKKINAQVSTASSDTLMKMLATHAKREFDENSYTVTLFVENESVKSQTIQSLNRSSLVMQTLQNNDIDKRCASKYSVSTIGSANAGSGGCIVYVSFDHHPCDVDRNSFVESSDADLILDALCGNIAQPKYADTDQNGSVTVYDAVLVLKTIK